MGPLHPDHIAGGRVVRTFRCGERQVFAGNMLSRDELLRMPAQNRNALIEKGFITIWPKEAETAGLSVGTVGGTRHVCALGFGRYDVVEGTKVNEAPLNREEAYALAGIEPPKGKGKGDADPPN